MGRDHGNQALEQSMDLSACWDCLAYSGDVLQHTLLAAQSDLGEFPVDLWMIFLGVVGGGVKESRSQSPRVPKSQSCGEERS